MRDMQCIGCIQGDVLMPVSIDNTTDNVNFIILDQQKPYGITTDLSGSIYVTPSSSPGILLPEHRTEKYNRNPDEVLKDLIEKRII